MRQSSLAAALVRVSRAQNTSPRIGPKSHVAADGGGLRSHLVPKSGQDLRARLSWQLLDLNALRAKDSERRDMW